MGQQLGGAGILLPPPQNFYPSELYNAPQDPSSNAMTLNAGDTFVVPAGNFFLHLGTPLIMQFKDPVNGIWTLPISASEWPTYVKSDGQNIRIANLTGCPVGAVVTNAGSGYNQATATAAATTGLSTWQPIVGGQLSVTSITVAGGNYGVPPILMIPPPPSPGLQATGYCTITSGSVSAVTLDNVGAGYTSLPTTQIVPSPFDPNLAAGITQATITMALVGSGSITGLLCTNPGAAVTSAPSITFAGGSSAAATAFLMQTMTGASVFSAGSGYSAGGAALTTVGGIPSATEANTIPLHEGKKFIPRPASALLAVPVGGSIASVSAIYDGGLFLGTPGTVVNTLSGGLITSSASVAANLGSGPGNFWMQPAP